MARTAETADRTRRRRRVTFQDVVRSIDPSRKSPLPIALFGRPLANVITAPIHNMGWSANAVTYVRSALSVVVLLLLGSGAYPLQVAAVFGFYVVFVLDCVDGNLARLADSASYWGKFVDGLSDLLCIGFAPLAVGIGLYLEEGAGGALMGGAAITAISLVHQLVRNRYSFFREWMVANTGALSPDDLEAVARIRRMETRAIGLLQTGTFLAPVLLCVPGGAVYFLLVLAAVQALPDAICIVAVLVQASATLRRHRVSVHAARQRGGPPATPR